MRFAVLVLLGSAAFVLTHLALVSPLLAPLFNAAGLGLLRGPVCEEAIKLALAVVFMRHLDGFRRPRLTIVLAVGLSAGLGETAINTFALFDGVVAELRSSLRPGEDPRLAEMAAYAAVAAKGVWASIGHALMMVPAVALLRRRRWGLAYLVQVSAHLLINLLVIAAS